MKSGLENWVKALVYHGLNLPYDNNILQYIQLLIKYMLEGPRYSINDLVRNITMMDMNMSDYSESLLNFVSQECRIKLKEAMNKINHMKEIADNNEIKTILKPPDKDIINKYICYVFNDDSVKNFYEFSSEIISTLNQEQKIIFDGIKIRFNGNQIIKAFIMGKAGTEKSYLINVFKNYFIANKIPFVLCASTGIAASLIGRRTVHSSFGIFLKDENIFCSLDIPKPNGYSMSYVSFIIIDETTMISAKVLNSIDYESRKLMKQKNDINSSKSSGGKNILLFGDMAQVPAVTKSNDDYLKAIAQFNQSDEFGGFIRWELNTIMRQDPNELDFIALLNYIRYHNDYEKIDERIEEISETRFIEKNIDEIIDQIDEFVGHDDKDGMIIITFTNKIANYHNLLILKKRNPENIFYFNAEFFIIFTYSYFANKNDNYNIFISKQQNLSKLYSASDGEKGN